MSLTKLKFYEGYQLWPYSESPLWVVSGEIGPVFFKIPWREWYKPSPQEMSDAIADTLQRIKSDA